jgi:hypothetical protein
MPHFWHLAPMPHTPQQWAVATSAASVLSDAVVRSAADAALAATAATFGQLPFRHAAPNFSFALPEDECEEKEGDEGDDGPPSLIPDTSEDDTVSECEDTPHWPSLPPWTFQLDNTSSLAARYRAQDESREFSPSRLRDHTNASIIPWAGIGHTFEDIDRVFSPSSYREEGAEEEKWTAWPQEKDEEDMEEKDEDNMDEEDEGLPMLENDDVGLIF